MSKFNVYQAIYEVSQQNKSASYEVKSDDRPYAEVLEIVRGEISKKHSGELANVITEPQGAALLKNLLSKYIYQKHIACLEYDSLNERVDKCYEDMAGFGFLTKYIYDDEVEEINCNAWNDIEIVTALGWKKIDEHFLSPMQCIDMTKKMCQLGGVIIDGSQPTQDSYITQGVRISAIIPPCIDDDIGAVFSIRKQKTNTITKEQLIKWDTATDDELDLLILCIEHGVSLGIAGSTGSGKTTDIGFILKNIAHDKRIYSIEDSRELDLQVRDEKGKIINRVIHTKTRPSNNQAHNVSADMLLKKALRFDPQIIVPAEMRGEEAMTAQEAGRTGHTIITSLHASTAMAAYTRILTMCMMSGTKLSEELMLKLIIEAYPIMAFKMQLPDKTRKYMKIIEAEDYRDGKIVYRTLYKYVITDRQMSSDGTRIEKMVGYHKKVSNISSRLANVLLENGADLSVIRRFAGNDWNPETDTED